MLQHNKADITQNIEVSHDWIFICLFFYWDSTTASWINVGGSVVVIWKTHSKISCTTCHVVSHVSLCRKKFSCYSMGQQLWVVWCQRTLRSRQRQMSHVSIRILCSRNNLRKTWGWFPILGGHRNQGQGHRQRWCLFLWGDRQVAPAGQQLICVAHQIH